MEKDGKRGRSQAEERFGRAKKTTEEARSIIDLEHDAMRKKTARLRALRLAKEADDRATLIEKKPAAKKPKKAPAKRK